MRSAVAGVVLALGVGLGGCSVGVEGTAVASPPASVFADTEGRFRLAPPPGWTVDTSGAHGAAVVFRDPEPTGSGTGRFNANIHVLVVASTVDLAATIVGARQELERHTGYRPAVDEPFTLTDGTLAHVLSGTFSAAASGVALRNVQLVTVHEGSTIIVTGTSPAGAWDAYGPVFDTSLRTLTVAA